MAFINQASRNTLSYINNVQQVGPGHYLYENTSIKSPTKLFSCAPFNSSTKKRTIYDTDLIKQKSMTFDLGPGSYNIENDSFIKNNYKMCVNSNNQQVIIKFNHIGSQKFISVVPRFKSLQPIGPGPGDYEKERRTINQTLEQKKKSLQKRKRLKNKIHQFITDLKNKKKISYKPSIPNQTFNLYKTKAEQYNQKNCSFQKKQRVKCFSWSKSQRNFIALENPSATTEQIGPGKYFLRKEYPDINILLKNQSKKRSSTQSSNFKSKAIRTYFDTICYETTNKQIANIRKLSPYKSQKPGPGYYTPIQDQIQNKNKRNIKYQFFGSTVQRFQTKVNEQVQNNNQNYFYLTENQKDYFGKKKSFNKTIKQSFGTEQKRNMSFLINNETIPGPGQYQSKSLKHIFKPKPGKKVQNFGNSIERFFPIKQEQIQQTVPKTNENEKIKQKAKQIKTKESFMFKSATKNHQIVKIEEKNNLLGKYKINNTDISQKLAKKQLFYQNLKRLEVKVPAFMSNNPRFDYSYNTSLQNLDGSSQKINKKTQSLAKIDVNQKIKKKQQRIRQKMIQQNQTQVVENKKSTLYNSQSIQVRDQRNQLVFIKGDKPDERYAYLNENSNLITPGVGQYSLRRSWNKKSYNVKYNKKIFNYM